MADATGLAEALLGLDGFRVLAAEEIPSEVIVIVETTADFVACPIGGPVNRCRGLDLTAGTIVFVTAALGFLVYPYIEPGSSIAALSQGREIASTGGVCWWTVMDAVVLYGTRSWRTRPGRAGAGLGIDETTFGCGASTRRVQRGSRIARAARIARLGPPTLAGWPRSSKPGATSAAVRPSWLA
jgi:hypothetical protein